MVYRITGLDPDQFSHMFALDDAALACRGARRVIADADRGFPCRVSLEDARAGEALVLVNHVSHDVRSPYRSTYAIYIRESADRAVAYVDRAPPVFAGRTLSLRGFGADAMKIAAVLVPPDEADGAIRALFDNPQIAYILAFNATYGCFAARIDRHGELSA